MIIPSNVSALPPVTIKSYDIAASGTMTFPSHAIGDLIVVYAWQRTTGYASLPSGSSVPWTTITSNSPASQMPGSSVMIAYAVANSSSVTSGTWSATQMAAVVLSNQGATPVGGFAVSATETSYSAPLTVPAITLAKTDGTSRLLYFGGGFNNQLTSVSPPTGYTKLAQLDSGGYSTAIVSKDITTTDGQVTIGYLGSTGTSFQNCGGVEIRATQ